MDSPMPRLAVRKPGTSQKYEGLIGWSEMVLTTRVKDAILRSNKAIALEFVYERQNFSGTLVFDGTRYSGEFRVRDGSSLTSVKANCRVFKADEEVLLFGTWVENSVTYKWWANLDPTDKL
jgi:hypothetical protein